MHKAGLSTWHAPIGLVRGGQRRPHPPWSGTRVCQAPWTLDGGRPKCPCSSVECRVKVGSDDLEKTEKQEERITGREGEDAEKERRRRRRKRKMRKRRK